MHGGGIQADGKGSVGDQPLLHAGLRASGGVLSAVGLVGLDLGTDVVGGKLADSVVTASAGVLQESAKRRKGGTGYPASVSNCPE